MYLQEFNVQNRDLEFRNPIYLNHLKLNVKKTLKVFPCDKSL